MNIILEQASTGCPEAYDAKDEHGNVVGYLGLRHGYFSVTAYGPGGNASIARSRSGRPSWLARG